MATLTEALDTATETTKPSKTLFTTSVWVRTRGNEWGAVDAEVNRVTTDLVSSGYLLTKTERVAFTDGTGEGGILGVDIEAIRSRE